MIYAVDSLSSVFVVLFCSHWQHIKERMPLGTSCLKSQLITLLSFEVICTMLCG